MRTSVWMCSKRPPAGFAAISSGISNLKKKDFREALALVLFRFAAGGSYRKEWRHSGDFQIGQVLVLSISPGKRVTIFDSLVG